MATREPNLDLDLYEEKDQIVVKAEMPGFTKDDIQISIADNVLTIKGEKKKEEEDSGKDYHRSERVYGAFTLPRAEKAKPRQIPLQVETAKKRPDPSNSRF